jgi:PAS domain S-box-containing protein
MSLESPPDRPPSPPLGELLPSTILSDSVPVGIAAVDRAGRQHYVNDAFARMVGWPREALVGAVPPFVYWPPEQLEPIREAFEQTLRGSAPAEGFSLRFQRRDGQRIDVLVHLGAIGRDAAHPDGWVAAVIDVSLQAALQRELAANEAKLRVALAAELAARRAAEAAARRLDALQRATSQLTATLTPQEVGEVVMRAALPVVNGARGAVAVIGDSGRSLEVIATVGYAPETRERYRTIPLDLAFPLSDAAREGRALLLPSVAARAARYPHLRALVEENGAGAMASIPLFAGGRVLGVIGINWAEDRAFTPDETSFLESIAQQCAQALERARLYQEERRARTEAEDANRAKSDFLAAMSHELRTPLNGIAGYVDLLELGVRGPLTDEQRLDLERIRFNQRHLGSLIEDVLSFARIEAGKLEVDRTAVPMDETLRSVHPLVAPQMEASGVRFTYEACPADLTALGDRERIVQICVNLLSNAAKATPSGGDVRLSCTGAGDRLLVRVTDTGSGIPADKVDAIFSPFTQLGRSLKAPRSGAGLGLSISRGLAEAMGGSLSVESEMGAGSTFTLALPRA